MIERCPKCNANLVMVGRSHRCVPMPEWAGGVVKKGLTIKPKSEPRPKPAGDGAALMSIAHPPGLIEKITTAIRSGKLGRPRIGEKPAKPKPWEALGMSERTYYRRQAEKREKAK